jgi:hypothetical protein
VGLHITGGLRSGGGRLVKWDQKFKDRTAKALEKLQKKYEEKLLAEFCKTIGWDEEAAAEAVAAAESDRDALLAADKTGRDEKQARRVAARV